MMIDSASLASPSAGQWCGGIPTAVAIVDGQAAVTYGELRRQVTDLAATIRLQLKEVDTPVVAIVMPPGLDFIVALLASLESGSLTVPLDAATPVDRLEEILHDANAGLVIVSPKCKTQLDVKSRTRHLLTLAELQVKRSDPTQDPPGDPGAKWRGAILYTSGSTGAPKGVVVSGTMLIREARSLGKRLEISSADRVSHLLSPSVIGGLREIFSCLVERHCRDATQADIITRTLPGNHLTLMTPPHVQSLARSLGQDVIGVTASGPSD